MSRIQKVALLTIPTLMAIPLVGYLSLTNRADPFSTLYEQNCAVCHGENLEGASQGTPLVGVNLKHGDSVAEIRQSVANGFVSGGMPGWSRVLSDAQISSLAIFVAEKRLDFDPNDYKVNAEISIPDYVIHSERNSFRIESFATDLDPLPFSIAPMPDGGFLLTERTKGMSIVSPVGKQSALIEGTPIVYGPEIRIGKIELPQLVLNPKVFLPVSNGSLMDVALHPEYETNGWVYLHYTDRCEENCNGVGDESSSPISMNRLDRGRIRDGKWVDVETIWQADMETYTSASDLDAGGRIAFDDQGHVFFSVGLKGGYYQGVQDLNLPYGKIHRVNDDGSVPPDNPYAGKLANADPDEPAAKGSHSQQTIWTYGHRNPQGLEFNRHTGELWSTEHGPRGGDEVNLLLPARNYGWPLYSKGLNYDGTPVDYGKLLGIEFDLKDIEQPVVDLTPSPAISSFVFYEGNAFPEWQHDMIVGSLKASDLYRLEIKDNKLIHKEILVKHLARIRDVEVGYDGLVYLLLESHAGGQIVRLVPERYR